MHLIGYMSESRIPLNEVDQTIEEIVAEAQLRNITNGITGVLFYHDGKFIQIIEGYQTALRDLIERIERDPRHGELHFFLDEQILNRTCPEWSMVSINLDNTQNLDHVLIDQIHAIHVSIRFNIGKTAGAGLGCDGLFTYSQGPPILITGFYMV